MQELNAFEIDDVSGGRPIMYDIGYAIAEFIQWARVPADEYAWSGGG